MITVEQIFALRDDLGTQLVPANTPEAVAVVNPRLDEDEFVLLEYLDAEVEKVAQSFRGRAFDVTLSLDKVPFKIIASLQKRWEGGDWLVGTFQRETETPAGAVQMVFTLPPRGAPPLADLIVSDADRSRQRLERSNAQPRVEVATDRGVPEIRTPLLVRMPTRGRPDQALRVLRAYRELAADPVEIEVVIDEDDGKMNSAVVLQRLWELDCTITIARHRNKIEAVNGGRRSDFAILVLASDDMVPLVHGYDRRIAEAMREHFPLLDGAIYFNDGYNKEHAVEGKPVLCTLPIFGRHLYDQFGYVYYPGYGSLYSDNEQTELLTAMNRLRFIDEIIIEHRHPAAGKAPNDAVYDFNDATYGGTDKQLFQSRSAMRNDKAQFAFCAPPLWLSILICSTNARAPMLRRLTGYLRAQMREYPREVEMCVLVDDGEMSIGAKRQALLERAVGHYVAFVDDDDGVSHDYVTRVLGAVQEGADCVSLRGVITTDGVRPEAFHHSLQYDRWFTRADGLYCRMPNHLNAVKRELALKAGFPSKSFGEDHEYSRALQPLIKTEATVDSVLYYYFFRSKKHEVHSA